MESNRWTARSDRLDLIPGWCRFNNNNSHNITTTTTTNNNNDDNDNNTIHHNRISNVSVIVKDDGGMAGSMLAQVAECAPVRIATLDAYAYPDCNFRCMCNLRSARPDRNFRCLRIYGMNAECTPVLKQHAPTDRKPYRRTASPWFKRAVVVNLVVVVVVVVSSSSSSSSWSSSSSSSSS